MNPTAGSHIQDWPTFGRGVLSGIGIQVPNGWQALPRFVKRVVLRMLPRNSFDPTIMESSHDYALVEKSTSYVPLLGHLVDTGYSLASNVAIVSPRQTGKSETWRNYVRHLLYKQVLWRVLAKQPTRFVDFNEEWKMRQATGKSTSSPFTDSYIYFMADLLRAREAASYFNSTAFKDTIRRRCDRRRNPTSDPV